MWDEKSFIKSWLAEALKRVDNQSIKLISAGFSAKDYDELVKYVDKNRHPLNSEYCTL
jgi:hypothetical protein